MKTPRVCVCDSSIRHCFVAFAAMMLLAGCAATPGPPPVPPPVGPPNPLPGTPGGPSSNFFLPFTLDANPRGDETLAAAFGSAVNSSIYAVGTSRPRVHPVEGPNHDNWTQVFVWNVIEDTVSTAPPLGALAPEDCDDFGCYRYAAVDAAPLPDGRLVVLVREEGAFWNPLYLHIKYYLWAFLPDTTRDSGFASGRAQVSAGYGQYNSEYLEPRLAVQPNGQIVVCIGAELFRYEPDGTVDANWPSVFLPTYQCTDLATTDERIFAVTEKGDLVAVLQQDGSRDASFGTNGVVSRPDAGGGVLHVQPDGRLLWANDGFVWRYNLDGSPDVSFGVGGALARAHSGIVEALDIAHNGYIVVAGSDETRSPASAFIETYLPNGVPEVGFGNLGRATYNMWPGQHMNTRGKAVVVRPPAFLDLLLLGDYAYSEQSSSSSSFADHDDAYAASLVFDYGP